MKDLPRQLELPFLGSRRYLHGTTLFDALRFLIPGEAGVCFKIQRRITSDRVEIIRLSEAALSPEALCATLTVTTGGVGVEFGVIPLPPSPAPARREFEEARVTDLAQFAPDAVELERPSPFSFIATVVPLNKALLSRRFSPQRPGQWFFSRLDLLRLPEGFIPLALHVAAVLGGGRLVKTVLSIGGVPTGELYFSWVPMSP